ncbi:N-acetyltransferase [Devosia sp. A8/3-2]|nr:N-acetyltransferase [Devosia sp. A8/3-2]
MSETELVVQREDGPTRGRYVIHLAPGYDAEMTFRKAENGTIIIDHTGVPPEYEGRGIAARLVKRAIEDARAGLQDHPGLLLCRRPIPPPPRMG